MDTFYCIYDAKEYPIEEKSKEHVIPVSLGGVDALCIYDVSRNVHALIGSKVDEPFVSSLPFVFERWRLQIKSQSGKIPDLVFRGTVEVEGKTLSGMFIIGQNGPCQFTTDPYVEGSLSNKLEIVCEPGQIEEVLANLERKAKRDNIHVSAEDLHAVEKNIQIETPWIRGKVEFDYNEFCRGFLRIALAAGHYLFGYEWSKGEGATRIREGITTFKDDSIPLIHGSIWPSGKDDHMLRLISRGPDSHVVVVMNVGRRLVFYCLFFGKYSGCIDMGEIEPGSNLVEYGNGIALVVDIPNRRLSKYELDEFLAQQEFS